jgi:hypothetical protein
MSIVPKITLCGALLSVSMATAPLAGAVSAGPASTQPTTGVHICFKEVSAYHQPNWDNPSKSLPLHTYVFSDCHTHSVTITTGKNINVGAIGGALTMGGFPLGGVLVFPIANNKNVTFTTFRLDGHGQFRRLCAEIVHVNGPVVGTNMDAVEAGLEPESVPLTGPFTRVYAPYLANAVCGGPLEDPMTGAVRYGTFRVVIREGGTPVGAVIFAIRH